MKISSTDKLKTIIRAMVEDAAPTLSPTAITDSIIKQHSELIDEWVRQRITVAVRAEIRLTRDPRQMSFPGFKGLSRELRIRRKAKPLGDATLTDLRLYMKTLRRNAQKDHPKVLQAKRLIDAMQPYARLKRGLTVRGFYEMLGTAPKADIVLEDTKPAKKYVQ